MASAHADERMVVNHPTRVGRHSAAFDAEHSAGRQRQPRQRRQDADQRPTPVGGEDGAKVRLMARVPKTLVSISRRLVSSASGASTLVPSEIRALLTRSVTSAQCCTAVAMSELGVTSRRIGVAHRR
jgi:hypothetical protein